MMDQRSAPLSLLQRPRRVQLAILVAFMLPLLAALFYLKLFLDDLSSDYWLRNELYPFLAMLHNLGSIGIRVTWFSAVLTCILLAHQGIERFGEPGDAPFHRLILVLMCIPVATAVLVSFPPLLPDTVAIPLFAGSLLLNSLLLLGWGIVRRGAVQRTLLYLAPWLGILLGILTPALGNLLFPPPHDTPPVFLWGALVALVSTPLSFAAAMVWLHLDTRARSILLTVVAMEALGMTLVQLMMLARLLVLNVLGLSTIWTAELLAELTVSVLFTALVLLPLWPWRKRKTVPADLAEDWVVEPLS